MGGGSPVSRSRGESTAADRRSAPHFSLVSGEQYRAGDCNFTGHAEHDIVLRADDHEIINPVHRCKRIPKIAQVDATKPKLVIVF
jgi:hypothetical protein